MTVQPQLPVSLYSAAQVRELDRCAIEDFGIPSFELMTRAGQACFNTIRRRLPDVDACTVFCGSGNNGGDGYIVAYLALMAGWTVTVHALSDVEALTGDARKAYLVYRGTGGTTTVFDPKQRVEKGVIVDAMLGTGLDRPVSGLYADAIGTINRSALPTFAADIPSGLQADTGKVMGCALRADCTVTFIGVKKGLLTGDAPDYCGELVYEDLAVPGEIFDRFVPAARRVEPLFFPPRGRCVHKGRNGRVAIVGGDLGYAGAVRLCGEAALRIGAGLVGIATRPEHAASINCTRPELMCRGIADFKQLDGVLAQADVIAIGPGLGRNAWSKTVFDTAMKHDKHFVVDADALYWLSDTRLYRDDWILTPHPGEAARLLNRTIADIEQDRYAAAEAIQRRYGGICVLKGAGSLVAGDRGIAVIDTGNPGMATGGMGDVLTGVIAGLLAQGFDRYVSAEQGSYLHGLAADRAAAGQGERGLLASDLMPYLRQAVNS